MAVVLDTDVAIHLRDGDAVIATRLADLRTRRVISVVSLVELQGGAASSSGPLRRTLLDRMLQTVRVLPFTDAEATAYGDIVAAIGHDRRRILDRMIAAQAIVADLTLITMNGPDFRAIPHLKLEVWKVPGQSPPGIAP